MTHESTSESPSPVDKSAYTIKSSTVLMAERGVPDSNPLPPAADTGTVEDLDEMAGLPIDAQGKPIDGAAAEAAEIIASFLSAYATRDLTQTCEQWLVEQFHRYPSLWNGDAEIESAAYEVASTIGEVNTQKASLNAAMAAGQSRANWFADSLERVTASQGIADVGAYAATIERALDQATLNSAKVIQRADGAISGCTNLDGFIAEQHHVDSFNIDVAAKGSTYSAEVMTPELGQPYRKNSVDLVIRDADSRVVRRYQSKYGADAEATNHLYKQGDYRGQRKLVPEGHSEGVSGSTETIEVDGISSSPLTKEQAKQQQYDAQQDGESKRYGWDQVSRGAIAHQIMKRSLLSATISVGFQGARILGRRAWNTLRGKPNTTISDDLREFFSSSLTSASNAALHTALAGAMVIAVKRGLLGRLLKQTPAGQIATATYIALENIKVLWKLGRGEITTDEALDAMGEITTVVLVTTFAMAEGSAIGMQIGAVFGPIGAAIGAFIGGVVAGIAGNAAGKLIYAGAKKLCTKVALNRPEFPSHLLAVYYGDQGDGYEQQAVYG